MEEAVIKKWGRRAGPKKAKGGILTNVKELEEEIWGEAWN